MSKTLAQKMNRAAKRIEACYCWLEVARLLELRGIIPGCMIAEAQDWAAEMRLWDEIRRLDSRPICG